MRQLSLVGISEDGTQLVLAAAGTPKPGTPPDGPPSSATPAGDAVGMPAGEPAGEFSVALDDRLRAATRGDRARLGQLDVRLESTLRPREIQSRIRAGDTAEDVARSAGITVDRVLRFAAPVLAEREHIVELARRNPLHRRTEPAGQSLDEAVAMRLTAHGVDPDSVGWDSHRQDIGWLVTATYRGGNRERTATFRFDPAARTAVADDDDARWIAGDGRGPVRPGAARALAPADSFDAMVAAELAAAGSPRGPEGFGRDGAPTGQQRPAWSTADRGQPARSDSAPDGDADEHTIDVPFAGRWPEMPGPATTPARDPRPPRSRTFARRERTASRAAPSELATSERDFRPAAEPEPEPAVERQARAEREPVAEPESEPAEQQRPGPRRRQAVPSWDEIMFGRRGE